MIIDTDEIWPNIKYKRLQAVCLVKGHKWKYHPESKAPRFVSALDQPAYNGCERCYKVEIL